MNILLISPLPPPLGGIGTWTEIYLESNIAKENNVEFINTSLTGSRLQNVIKRSIKDEVIRSFNIWKSISTKMKCAKYDIIHMNSSCSLYGMVRDFISAKLIKRHNGKLIMHYHCDTQYMVKGRLALMFFKKISRIADEIIVLNKGSYFHVKEISERESVIIPNFFNMNKYDFSSEKIINNEIKNIVFVGNVIKSKGCDEILEVAKLLPNINFKMIGHLSKEINIVNVSKNVEFLGELSKVQVLEHMLGADVLLFPSYTEGFPNVVLESMACGLPIIATNVGAIPDMIENDGGILVKRKSVEEIINAIKRLEKLEVRQKISEWNKNKVKRNYTIDIVSLRLLKLYAEI